MEYYQATPSTGDKARLIVAKDTYLTTLGLKMGTTGSTTSTDLDVEVDGSVVASVSVLPGDADGTFNQADLATPVLIPAGSTVELVVSQISTSPAEGEGVAVLSPALLEA